MDHKETRSQLEAKAKEANIMLQEAYDKIADFFNMIKDKLAGVEDELKQKAENHYSSINETYSKILGEIDSIDEDNDDGNEDMWERAAEIARSSIPIWVGPAESDIDAIIKNLDDIGSLEKVEFPAPENFEGKLVSKNAIKLIWDEVDQATSYIVEMRRSNESTFMKIEDVEEAEFTYHMNRLDIGKKYIFRVCASMEDALGAWSEPIEVKTKHPKFTECCEWKECPEIFYERRYSTSEENSMVVTKEGKCEVAVVGSAALPLNKTTCWNVRVVASRDESGESIYVGAAPSDIDQGADGNYRTCGWYLCCYNSTLWSGPPHRYTGKEYGQRKGEGEYVKNGSVVGVLMDTTKGELSFAVNGVNLGVAFDGIPLDKPLVPCVVLKHSGDSVELVL